LLIFCVGSEWCALPVDRIEEVVPIAALSKPPGLPGILEGFLNLRGSAVPVVRLDRLFNLNLTSIGLYSPLVVVHSATQRLALLVDQAIDIIRIPVDGLFPVAKGTCFKDCADAEVEVDGRTAHLLSVDRLLLAEERQRIADLQAMAQSSLAELES
jgi:purine-binding chemotaxis protein CheW